MKNDAMALGSGLYGAMVMLQLTGADWQRGER
jgi:hypothetical protein